MKQELLPAIRTNVGLEVAYARELEMLVSKMHNSVLYWITAAWNKNTPEMTELLAMDESPSVIFRKLMRALARRWQAQFDLLGPELAKHYAKNIKDRQDGALKKILKKRGWSVEFQTTRAMNDVMQAEIGENVALIKSIASQYFTGVEGAVLRAAAEGRDLKTLYDFLGPKVDLARIRMGRKPGESDRSFFARTNRRAAFIARDQSNKMTAAVQKVRQTELGIEEAIWMHSGAGKHPRPEHVRWGAQKARYKVAEGMYSTVAKKHVWPGTEPNCRCTNRPYMPWVRSQREFAEKEE